jgi:hypothetical protein
MIDPQGDRDVSSVDVQDSYNINSQVINPSNSIDSGNNINWFIENGGTPEPPEPPEPPDPPEPPPVPPDPEDPEDEDIEIPDEPVEEPEEPPVEPPSEPEEPEEEPEEPPPDEPEEPEDEPEEPEEEPEEPEEEDEEPSEEEEEIFEEELEAEEEDPFGPQDKKKKYKKKYIKGKYRTVVIVFEGRVVACPYDEEGPQFEEGTSLTKGQRTIQEGGVR